MERIVASNVLARATNTKGRKARKVFGIGFKMNLGRITKTNRIIKG
jgi:hypothetical protein